MKQASKSGILSASEWVERVIAILLFLSLLWYILSCFMPFLLIAEARHLNWIRTALLAADLLMIPVGSAFSSGKRRAPGIFFLYGICLFAAVSSYLQREYGYADNFINIAWMTVVFGLFYGAVYRMKRSRLRFLLCAAYWIVMILWLAACCLSLYQFIHLIGTDPSQKVTSIFLKGKGFLKGRLHGIFGYPEYGAVTSVLLMIWSFYYAVRTRSHVLRVFLVLINLPLFWYMVLSGSRNAVVTLYAAVFAGVFLVLYKKFQRGSKPALPRALGALGGAFIALLCVYLAISLTLSVSEKVPAYFSESGEESADSDRGSGASQAREADGIQTIDGAVAAFPAPFLNDVQAAQSGLRSLPGADASSVPGHGGAAEKSKDKEKKKKDDSSDDGILTRKDVQRNPSTFRLTIWKEYLGLYKEIGLFGLSPENSSKYIKEHHPELFIADYIRRAYPDDYERGYVFHPHSGYLKVFVSSGFLGLLLLLYFLIRCCVSVFLYLRRRRNLPPEFLFSFLIVFAAAVTAVFDMEVFFVYNPSTFLFWGGLGVMLRAMVRTHTFSEHNS